MIARSAKYLAHLKTPPGYEERMKAQKFPINEKYWGPPRLMDKKFLWTDKSEQSFRGLYYSDPEIDKLYDVLNDTQDFFANKLGVSYETTTGVTESIRSGIRTWSKFSADRMNRDSPKSKSDLKPKDEPKR